MSKSRWISSCAAAALTFLVSTTLTAQCTDGRIFLSTDDTVAIWEMNSLPVLPGEVVPDGTVIGDLSGNGLDAVIEASGDSILAGNGDPLFDVPKGNPKPSTRNTTLVKQTSGDEARLVVNNDGNAFEFSETDDFSLELYIQRDEITDNRAWGILAGTFHSRNSSDKELCPDCEFGCRNDNGSWYGWGLMRHGGDNESWTFNLSPVNPDGSLKGTGCCNELNPGPVIEFTPGAHYFVASIDRTAQTATYYVDAVEVGSSPLGPEDSFITPTDHDHARFIMLSGEDDISCGAYRGAPTGYHLDAARVQRKAMSFIDVEDNYFSILDGESSPATASNVAVVTASNTDVLVSQCIRLSGEASCVNEGETIESFEWKIGDEDFEEGDVTREISFDAETRPEGVEITMRVTSSSGGTSTASIVIVVRNPVPTARILAFLGPDAIPGNSLRVPLGETLTLDGESSSTVIPPGALACPLVDNLPIDSPLIESYEWDLDGDGTIDSKDSVLEVDALTEGTFTTTLRVTNSLGTTDETSIEISVVEAARNGGRVFSVTDETVGIWEFNNFDDLELLPGDIIPDGSIFPDLSGNGLDATVESNAGDLIAGEGDLLYNAPANRNGEIRRVANSSPARVAVNEDDDDFEMEFEDDFAVELYVHRENVQQAADWGILAGTWHSRNLQDDLGAPNDEGAWYGYGLIRYSGDPTCPCPEGTGGWRWTMSPVVDGIPRIGFGEIPEQHLVPGFEIPNGRHYVVLSVDRSAQVATTYVDGERVSELALDPTWTFTTPIGYEHARFMFFAGEDDPTRGSYRSAPAGANIDAARVQRSVLSEETIQATWSDIQSGRTSPPTVSKGNSFVRGDADTSGAINITDGIFILNFLFLGGPGPICNDAADVDDSSAINITDGIYVLNFLFLGGPDPAAPHPNCGTDPEGDEDGVTCEESSPSCL